MMTHRKLWMKLDTLTVKGLDRLALALRLERPDQSGSKKDRKKDKIGRLANYHDESLQQADDLLDRLDKVSYREQQSRPFPSV